MGLAMEAHQYLDRGERLIWAGNPDPMRYALGKGLAPALVGIPFLAFSVFWVITASEMAGGEGFFFLFGIPFVLVGAGLVLSPALLYWRAGGVAYVLTDRRAVIDISGPFGGRTSIPLDQMPFVMLKGLRNGIGHVLFQEHIRRGRRGRTYTTQDGFFGIADAELVERQLRDAISRLREQSAGSSG